MQQANGRAPEIQGGGTKLPDCRLIQLERNARRGEEVSSSSTVGRRRDVPWGILARAAEQQRSVIMENIDSLGQPQKGVGDRLRRRPAAVAGVGGQLSNGLMAMVLGLSLSLGVAACANPPADPGQRVKAANSRQPSSQFPRIAVAERDFPTAAIVIDDRSAPKKVWLLSSPSQGTAQALEFFSGERVAGVRVEPSASSAPGERLAYSFTDRSGRRYASVHAMASSVDTDQPSAYAGWDGKDGAGHDVMLGAPLFERNTAMGPDGVAKMVNRAVDPRAFFGGQLACEEAAYVARTQASNSQDSEPGFVPRAKILADYDATKRCWNTQPIHAVNLEDNTFLIATRTRVFRISSKDLTPVGTAPSMRIVDIKE